MDVSWGVDAVTAVWGVQTAANTLAPYAAQVIGQEYGHGEDKNTAAQLVSHAILSATLAYINGGDPTAGEMRPLPVKQQRYISPTNIKTIKIAKMLMVYFNRTYCRKMWDLGCFNKLIFINNLSSAIWIDLTCPHHYS